LKADLEIDLPGIFETFDNITNPLYLSYPRLSDIIPTIASPKLSCGLRPAASFYLYIKKEKRTERHGARSGVD
jgi:hypothetical protein